jgi:[acyl-carrier-protein] S-malonyltransferase
MTKWNIQVAMGLSLGEYTALCFAKAFSFEDGVRLTQARGEAMQYASDLVAGGMLGVSGITEAEATHICTHATQLSPADEFITIGNHLSPTRFSLSGSKGALSVAQDLLATSPPGGKSVSVTLLAVAGAFHTRLMTPAASQLEQTLNAITINAPTIPVLCNVDATPHTVPDDIRRKLLAQLVTPVQWGQALEVVLQDPDFQCAYEIGPGKVCGGILKSIRRRAVLHSISV